MRFLVLVFLVACDRPPSKDVREWTPQDHDRIDETSRIGQGAKPGQADPKALIEIAWQQQCSSCHGAGGKGDGPQAAMFKPADLTREEWQSKTSDAEIAAAIKNGKGRMPKFEALDDQIVAGLVARIRSLRAK
jgi:cytochrome c oxidase cbb3-type subunit 3